MESLLSDCTFCKSLVLLKNSSQSKAGKVAWCCVVLLGFSSAGYLIHSSYSDWQASPVSTSITTHPIADLDSLTWTSPQWQSVLQRPLTLPLTMISLTHNGRQRELGEINLQHLHRNFPPGQYGINDGSNKFRKHLTNPSRFLVSTKSRYIKQMAWCKNVEQQSHMANTVVWRREWQELLWKRPILHSSPWVPEELVGSNWPYRASRDPAWSRHQEGGGLVGGSGVSVKTKVQTIHWEQVLVRCRCPLPDG